MLKALCYKKWDFLISLLFFVKSRQNTFSKAVSNHTSRDEFVFKIPFDCLLGKEGMIPRKETSLF